MRSTTTRAQASRARSSGDKPSVLIGMTMLPPRFGYSVGSVDPSWTLFKPQGRARLSDERPRPRPRDILRVGRALKLVWSVARGWTAVSVALTVLQGVLPAATVWLTKLIVDAVAQGVGEQDSGALFRHVALLIVLAGAVALAAVLLRSAQTLVDEILGQVVSDHVTDLIHAQSVAVDLEYYENPRYHDALYRAQQEAPYRPTSIVKNLTATGQAVVSLAAMVALLLTLHWLVGLVVLAAAIPAAVVRLPLLRQVVRLEEKANGDGAALLLPSLAANRQRTRQGGALSSDLGRDSVTSTSGSADSCGASRWDSRAAGRWPRWSPEPRR